MLIMVCLIIPVPTSIDWDKYTQPPLGVLGLLGGRRPFLGLACGALAFEATAGFVGVGQVLDHV